MLIVALILILAAIAVIATLPVAHRRLIQREDVAGQRAAIAAYPVR